IARKLRDAGVPGSLEELRAMAFMALLTGRDLDTLLPGAAASDDSDASDDRPAPRLRPAPGELASLSGTVNLTVPLATWLGSSDAPGVAAGFGPLGADD